MNGITVSVIIPVYNGEKYLVRCLDSIVCQTYTSLEIIVVDDGSKDSSLSIAETYAEKDSRIKVFHKDNGGVSSARNFGLNHATGTWLTFVDSDDFVDKDYINSFFEIENPFKERIFYITGEKEGFTVENLKPNVGVYKEGSLADSDVLLSMNLNATCWGKLFHRDTVEKMHLRFNEKIFYGEDKVFTIQYLSAMDSVRVNKSKFPYNYVNALNLKSYLRPYEKEKENFISLAEGIHSYWQEGFSCEWIIPSFKLVYYSLYSQRYSKSQRIKYLNDFLSVDYARQTLEVMSRKRGFMQPLWQLLNKKCYGLADLICVVSVPLVVGILSKKHNNFLKGVFKRIG